MRSFMSSIQWRFGFLRKMSPHVGLIGALRLQLSKDWNRVAESLDARWTVREVSLRPKGYATAVTIRLNSSDFKVFDQIFVSRQYLPVTIIKDLDTIVDCGANAGYSALFFLKQFPRARVIAVEPDRSNAELCRRNLSQYMDRVVIVEKAVWGCVAQLRFVEETRTPGEEWGIQVRAAAVDAPGEAVEGIDIPNLMAMIGVEHIDLLKIDIERSEAVVFQSNPESWLCRVTNLAIELHGECCAEIFRFALRDYSFLEEQCGDVTICLGMLPRAMNRS